MWIWISDGVTGLKKNESSGELDFLRYSVKGRSAGNNSKQSEIVAIDSCFALFGARQYGVTTRESSDEKYPRTLIEALT